MDKRVVNVGNYPIYRWQGNCKEQQQEEENPEAEHCTGESRNEKAEKTVVMAIDIIVMMQGAEGKSK